MFQRAKKGKMVRLMLLGTLFSFVSLHKSLLKKLDGYHIPVYSAQFCPRNETEWKTRSEILNCTEKNGYTCLPNEHFTGLLQFCYRDPHILIEEGLCLYLIKKNSLVHGHRCKNFQFGCPSTSYLSTKIYNYQSCILVENGCFLAEPTCERAITNDDRKSTKQTDNKKRWALFGPLLTVCLLTLFCTLFIISKRKNQKNRKENGDIEKCKQGEKAPMIKMDKTDEVQKKAPTKDENIKSKYTSSVVAAIDFGTSYTVYAYSRERSQIHIEEWNSEIHIFSSKASTSLILNPDQTFLAFGYDAGENYFRSEEKITKENSGKYFFPEFKVLLYKQNLDLKSEIEDIDKKKIEALSIFSMIIEHFKESLLETMKLSSFEMIIPKSDVNFVLAVPASCGEGAKDLMREAAKKAGIEASQLTIINEDEAISSYCQHNPFYDNMKENEYMIVNLGGGSVDIAVYKKATDGNLQKLYPSTRRRCWTIPFDDEYVHLMENIWGEGVIETFANDHMEDYLIMQTTFEKIIRETFNLKEEVTLNIPLSLQELLKKKYEGCGKKVSDFPINTDLTYRNYRLKLPHDVIREFLQKIIENVSDIIEQNVQKTTVKNIIIVGGLAQIDIIQDYLQKRLCDYKIVRPPTAAGHAVLNGAVYYGQHPNAK